MSNENLDKEIPGHSYDGISESDNPMPAWWIWTFLLTIIFAFIYYLHYSFGGGPTLAAELKIAMAEIEKVKGHEPALDENEEILSKAMAGSQILAMGSEVYVGKCAACHGQALQGQIGPNLTDKYWIHGKGTRMDVVKVIRQGVVDKGMPAWQEMISKDEIYAVAAFIFSKLGSNPENAKAPQGELVQ